MTLQLLQLAKHYAALSPTTPSLIPSPPFPSARELSLPRTQDWLVAHLLSSDNDDEDLSRQAWKKVFWRRVVKGIEQGFEERKAEGGELEVEDEEVHEAILEEMVKHLSSSAIPSSSLKRTYWWGRLEAGEEGWESVQTREDGRMISGGTTGLRTWQACISLSNHLIASPSIFSPSCTSASPPRILELGAGVGLLSLVASKLAPETRIVATDVDEKVLQQLEQNVELNGMEARVEATTLDWELAERQDEPLAREQLEQWERDTFSEGRATLILGADIVYDPALTWSLASTLAFLLRPSTSTFDSAPSPSSVGATSPSTAAPTALIACTIRNASTWEIFEGCCREAGLLLEELEMSGPAESGGIVGAEGWEKEGEVKLVRITRAEGGEWRRDGGRRWRREV